MDSCQFSVHYVLHPCLFSGYDVVFSIHLQDVIKIINVILCDEDAPPSLRNAAVECLEQWLRLPGIELLQWQPALLPFLGNLSDRYIYLTVSCILSEHVLKISWFTKCLIIFIRVQCCWRADFGKSLKFCRI